MQSEINICNMALGFIGSEPINSFNDASQNARVCRNNYEHVRDYLLSAFDWVFNKKTVKLVRSGSAEGWESCFAYPVEALYIVCLFSPDGSWSEREGDIEYDFSLDNSRRILAHVNSDVYAVCRVRAPDVSKWPAYFSEVVAWSLAVRLALALAKSKDVASSCMSMYQEALARAVQNSANERSARILMGGSWLEARGE